MSAYPPVTAFECPWCSVEAGDPCRTPAGRATFHRTRLQVARDVWREGQWAVRMKRDDPRFGLDAGDLLLVTRYWLDPNKVTVIRRVSDGFDPECNQYSRDVEFVSFDTNKTGEDQ